MAPVPNDFNVKINTAKLFWDQLAQPHKEKKIHSSKEHLILKWVSEDRSTHGDPEDWTWVDVRYLKEL